MQQNKSTAKPAIIRSVSVLLQWGAIHPFILIFKVTGVGLWVLILVFLIIETANRQTKAVKNAPHTAVFEIERIKPSAKFIIEQITHCPS